MRFSPYIRLMRLTQPVGAWLLFWPCAWALTLAGRSWADLQTVLLFAVGAVVMRAAGCVVNDLVDVEFDAQVERTKTRPLASGELQKWQALVLLVVLLAIGLCIAIKLGSSVVGWAVLSLPLVVSYPFMKRISWWPQLFLGFTFNWGIWMGWAAVRGGPEWATLVLYLAGICWTLGYDTIYAHQDKVDDARIGVKSTALRLGEHTKRYVGIFYTLMILLMTLTGWLCAVAVPYYAVMGVVSCQAAWQVWQVDLSDRMSCLRVFKSNSFMGLLVFIACLAGMG